MKKNYLLLSLMAGALLTGCSSNEDFTESEMTVDRETTNFLKVNIAQSGTLTRANNFDTGTEAERKINSLFFVFYDAAGNNIATQTIGANKIDWDNSQGNNWSHKDDGNISDTRSLVIEVNLAAGAKIPSKMMVFANYINQSQSGQALENIKSETRSDYKDADGYFTMNNSVYYDGTTKKMEVPVSIDDFKPKEDDADKSNGITVHLERLAAKVTVNIEESVKPTIVERTAGTDANKKYFLRFMPQAWGLNALENETYLVKHFTKDKYDEINANLSPWTWNDETNKRCYWGHSVSYEVTNSYPRVSDDLDAGEDSENAKLKYVTFNEIMNKGRYGADLRDDPNDHSEVNNVLYCMEHTTSSVNANAEYKNSAITSAVIAGQYRIYENESDANAGNDNYLKAGIETDNATPATFYIYDNKMYVSDNEIMSKLVTGQNIIKKKTADGEPVALDEADYMEVFDISHPSKEVRGKTKVGESYVTIQVKNGRINLENGYSLVYLNANGTYENYTSDNRNEANIGIYQQVGRAEKFNNGSSYYAVLIKHLNPIPQADSEDNITYKAGNYGVLRNHSYTLNINSINGLGVGINDPNRRIVLPTESIGYHVETTLNILSWNVVSAQDVDLTEPIQ